MVKSIRATWADLIRFCPMRRGCDVLRILLLWLLLSSGSSFAKNTGSTTLSYRISRNGEAIGTYRFDIAEGGKSRTVHAVMHIEVKLLQIPIYKASHERTGVWRGDELVSLKGQSLYNGKSYKMEMTRNAGECFLKVNGATEKLASDCFSFVPWPPEKLVPILLLTEKGQLKKVTITDLGIETLKIGGKELPLRHIVYEGQWARHAWYGEDGILAAMTYDLNGSQIRIDREAKNFNQ